MPSLPAYSPLSSLRTSRSNKMAAESPATPGPSSDLPGSEGNQQSTTKLGRRSIARAARACKLCMQEEWASAKEAFWEVIQFIRTHNWKQTIRFLCRRKFWPWWFLLAVVVAASTVLSSYHNQIVTAMHPYSKRIAASPYAWIVPLVLLVIVSFPPLFGHEIILLLCGMMWGLGKGFAIAAAGTFLGELACYVAFKYLFRARAAKLESRHTLYACIAQLMRENGLGMLVLVRFSVGAIVHLAREFLSQASHVQALPGHLVTAIQSTIGIGVTRYAIAAFLTLPKQFSIVYLGRVYGETGEKVDKTKAADDQTGLPLTTYYSRQHTKISLIVFAVTTLATIVAAYIVWQKARRIRPRVEAQMAERRKLEGLEMGVVTLASNAGDTGKLSQRSSVDANEGKTSALQSGAGLGLPQSMTFPEGIDEGILKRPAFVHKDSSAPLMDSWDIRTPPFPARARSDTIEHLLLESPRLLAQNRSSSRSRSGTMSSVALMRTPSLPHLPSYVEVQEYDPLPPAVEYASASNGSPSRRASAIM